MADLLNSDLVLNEKSISFDSYEKMAEYYFEYVDTKPFNAYYERPATLSLLPSVTGKKVLDAGCAAGWYSEWLIEKGANVIALDFSPSMIEKHRLFDLSLVPCFLRCHLTWFYHATLVRYP